MTHINAQNVAMAKGMARRFIARDVPPNMRSRLEDDITSDALLALVEADRTFDSDAHDMVPFGAYAAAIIKYRMIDGLRVLLGRPTTSAYGTALWLLSPNRDPNVAAESVDERMDRMVGGCDDALASEVEDQLAMQQFVQVITFHLCTYGTQSERYVFAHRLLGETLKQIGATLGVGESRVCQIDRDIRRRLRRLQLEYPR